MTIVLDIDGTLADHSHRLHYIMTPGRKKDWPAYYSSMGQDPPVAGAKAGVERLQQGLTTTPNHGIVFVTGRPEEYRQLTADWLFTYFGIKTCRPSEELGREFCRLHMRPTLDYRASRTYKEEVLKTLWGPMLIFDDDLRNEEMYKRYGFFFVAPACWNVLR